MTRLPMRMSLKPAIKAGIRRDTRKVKNFLPGLMAFCSIRCFL